MVVEKLVSAIKEGAVPIALGAGVGAAIGALTSRFVPTLPPIATTLTGAVFGGGLGYMASEAIVPGTGKTAAIGAALPVAAVIAPMIAGMVAPAVPAVKKQSEYLYTSTLPVYTQEEIEEEARRRLVTID